MKTRLLLYTFFIMLLLCSVSCGKSDGPDDSDNDDKAIKEKIALLETTSGQIEKALTSGDHAAFLGFFTPEYSKYYRDAVQANAAKLIQFADVFKTRKLLTCNGYYAVYEVEYNGKKFEISFILDDAGNWKLKDM